MAWRRQAARVIVLGPARTVLLIEGRDPADPSKGSWWEIPGGGIDPGEEPLDAAARELTEETGILGARMGPCVWTQEVNYTFGGFRFDQDEFIFVATVDDHDQSGERHLEPLEAMAFGEQRWWNVDDVLAGDFAVLPVRLRDFLGSLADGEVPAEPVALGFVAD